MDYGTRLYNLGHSSLAGLAGLTCATPRKYGQKALDAAERAIDHVDRTLDHVEKKLDEEEARKRKLRRKAAAEKAERDAKVKEHYRDQALAPVERLLEEGRRANTNGLKAKNLSQAKSGFETAAARYKHAIKRADKGLKDTKDEQVAKGLQEMRTEAVQSAVDVYLNLANTYSSRGSHVEAHKYCNQALALDPENASAKSLRASLGGGGWSRRRGGRR